MTLALPRRLNNGDDGDADNAMEIIDALAAAFPVTDANQSAISASKVTIPSGFAWPASTIPSSIISAASMPSGVSDLSADPQFSRAYGAPFTRKIRASEWTAPSGGGYPCPIRDGVLLPSFSNDRVYEIPRNSTGGQDSLFVSMLTHTFSSGDKPIHAVAKDTKQAYVLCQGNGAGVYPSIKLIETGKSGGTATSFLSLGTTYTSAYKMAINRQGSYLYVLAKRSGDLTWRRLLRVDTATLAVSESDLGSAAGNEVYDLCISSHFASATQSLGAAVVAMYDASSAQNTLYSVREATGDVYGGSFLSGYGAYHTVEPATVAGRFAGACIFRGTIVAGSSSGTNVQFDKVVPDPNETTWRITSSSSLSSAVQWADSTSAYPATLGSSAQSGAIAGSVSTDGTYVFMLMAGGAIAAHDPIAGTIKMIACPNPSVSIVSTADFSSCGMAFSGKHMIGLFNKTSDGTGYLFAL